MTLSGRVLRKHLRPFFADPNSSLHIYKPIYDLLGWFFTLLMINYCVMPFYNYSWKDSMIAWGSIWFSGHILMLSVLVLLSNKLVIKQLNASKVYFIKKEQINKEE